jgi:N-acetylmuramoyl-L-alanine amidase
MPTVEQFAIASALNGCSTAGLQALDDQIVEVLLAAVNTGMETNLVSCTDIPLLKVVGNSTIPLLQPAARKSLKRVIEQKGRQLNLIHAYRTIAQQFVLREWKRHGKCRITAARDPGSSDHERAIAIDIDDHEVWKEALKSNGWVWAGPGDRGHFSFHGDGVSPKVLTESVRAFQILWNRNHPEDPIDEDGVFGDIETGPRLLLAPVEGFEIV